MCPTPAVRASARSRTRVPARAAEADLAHPLPLALTPPGTWRTLVLWVRTSGPTLITSVQRAFRLLEAVSAHENGAPAKQLARETGLPLATAYHLLRTLVHDGYLRKLDDGGFILGDKLRTLQTVGRGQALLSRVRPTLAALRDELADRRLPHLLRGGRDPGRRDRRRPAGAPRRPVGGVRGRGARHGAGQVRAAGAGRRRPQGLPLPPPPRRPHPADDHQPADDCSGGWTPHRWPRPSWTWRSTPWARSVSPYPSTAGTRSARSGSPCRRTVLSRLPEIRARLIPTASRVTRSLSLTI